MVLKQLYGNGTRAVQVFSTGSLSIWFILIILHSSGVFILDLPSKLTNLSPLLILNAVGLLFGVSAFLVQGRKHQIFKAFGLVCGSLFYAILAISFATGYPPFEPILIVATGLSLWFLGAFYYIIKHEDIYGTCSK